MHAYLAERRGRGESFRQIAAGLHDLGLEVTDEAVRMWAAALGLHTVEKRAS